MRLRMPQLLLGRGQRPRAVARSLVDRADGFATRPPRDARDPPAPRAGARLRVKVGQELSCETLRSTQSRFGMAACSRVASTAPDPEAACVAARAEDRATLERTLVQAGVREAPLRQYF